MILNLTDMEVQGAEVPEGSTALVLMDALYGGHLDETLALINELGPTAVVVDIDEEFFEELQAALEGIQLILGGQEYYECA